MGPGHRILTFLGTPYPLRRRGYALAAGMLVGLVAYLWFGHLSPDAPSDAPTGHPPVAVAPANATAATHALTRASDAMETLHDRTGSYADGAAGASQIDRSVRWVTGPADATAGEVSVQMADTTGYTLLTTVPEGVTYTYARAMTGLSRGCGPGCTW